MHNMDLTFVLKEFKELITVNKIYTQNVINISSIKAVENKLLVQFISKLILSIKFSISELTNNRAVSTAYQQVNLKSRFQFHVLIQIIKLSFSFSLTVFSFCASLLLVFILNVSQPVNSKTEFSGSELAVENTEVVAELAFVF